MKITIALLAALAAGALAPQDMHRAPAPLEQHKWLQQLVGEWTARAEATMEPGAEPMRIESVESVRSIGGLWIVAESRSIGEEPPLTSVLQLGYDPDQKGFVGTWIDSMQTRMWTYRGELDAAREVLTLQSEGPFFGDPAKSARYRDVIELTGPDTKVLSSSVETEDGTWIQFLRAEYKRKE